MHLSTGVHSVFSNDMVDSVDDEFSVSGCTMFAHWDIPRLPIEAHSHCHRDIIIIVVIVTVKQ